MALRRDIRFRLWDGKEMKYRFITTGVNGDLIEVRTKPLKEGDVWELMEFTGIKDKNDKDIFEGDLVTNDDNGTWDISKDGQLPFFEVKFGKYCLDSTKGEDPESWHYGWYLQPFEQNQEQWSLACGKFTVVGNIHQNQELISAYMENLYPDERQSSELPPSLKPRGLPLH